jgi:hypothetical protein
MYIVKKMSENDRPDLRKLIKPALLVAGVVAAAEIATGGLTGSDKPTTNTVTPDNRSKVTLPGEAMSDTPLVTPTIEQQVTDAIQEEIDNDHKRGELSVYEMIQTGYIHEVVNQENAYITGNRKPKTLFKTTSTKSVGDKKQTVDGIGMDIGNGKMSTTLTKLSNPNINSPYRPSELLEINPDVESHAFKPDKVTIIITTDTGEVYQSSQKIDEVPKGIYIPIDGKTWLNKLPNGHRPNNVLKPVNTNIANINQVRVEYRDSDHDTEIAQTFDRVPAEDQQ